MNHVLVSRNGRTQVTIDTSIGKVKHTHYKSDGSPWIYPTAVSTQPWSEERTLEYLKELNEDPRYLDMSHYSVTDLEEWRRYQQTAHERMVINNEPTGSAWKAMGNDMVGEGTYEEFFGHPVREHH